MSERVRDLKVENLGISTLQSVCAKCPYPHEQADPADRCVHRDLHVNRALRESFERREDNAPAPRSVVLEKSAHDKLQTASLQSHNFWAYQLKRAFNTGFKFKKKGETNE